MNGRKIIDTKNENYSQYNRYGKSINGLHWLPLSGGVESSKEVFMINFDPGSCSKLHIHQGSEEFYVVEGELIDDDGKKFKQGDFVRFEPRTKHFSYSNKGCKLLVILSGGKNKIVK